jgi:peptidoglycan/xylan/chitin deacetylase (PgdA/CDA1 family)
MAASGLVEIAAHTHTHGDFRGRPDALRADLRTNVESLRSTFGLDRVTFAFPFGRKAMGYVTDELLEAARQTGVACALTTEAELVDPRSNPFGWGRFNAYHWDTAVTLAAKLAGWYGWAPRLQERVAGVVRRRGRHE